MKVCPECRSADVRRSYIRSAEAKLHLLFSPYRCNACDLRFWVISRRVRMFGALMSGVCIATAIVAAIWAIPMPDFGSKAPTSAQIGDEAVVPADNIPSGNIPSSQSQTAIR